MISFTPALTDSSVPNANMNHVVDHIEYAANRIGYDHVGIGTDFDGMEKSVQGLEDVSKFPDLVELMLTRGISRANVEKVIGLNIIRVLKEVETVAGMRKQLPSVEDRVKQLWSDEIRGYVRQVYPDKP